jgi:hypothetical protein
MTEHADLPLPDYDHVTVGALPAAIAPLGADEVQQLLDYEREHAHRLPVTTVLERRIERLRSGEAEPSAGGGAAGRPETNAAPGGKGVSPATSGPPINPPSHGTPTNPAQPR